MNKDRETAKLIIKDPAVKELGLTIELTKTVGKIWHTADCLSDYYSKNKTIEQSPRTELMHTLKITTTCPDCIFEGLVAKNYLLLSLISFEKSVKELEELFVTRDYSLFDIQRSGFDYRQRKFQAAVEDPAGIPDSMLKRLKKALSQTQEIEDKISAASKNEEARSALKEDITPALVPREWVDRAELDSEMVLIGLVGDTETIEDSDDTEIKFVLDSYRLFSKGEVKVCYAPRYIHSYFIYARTTGFLSQSTLVVSAPDPGSEENRYAAARLWDPYGDGPLASLAAAVAAAQAL